jgi:hypothetical protein
VADCLETNDMGLDVSSGECKASLVEKSTKKSKICRNYAWRSFGQAVTLPQEGRRPS